jgi:hypothetical protein
MKLWNYMMIMLTMMIFLAFLGFSPAGSKGVLSDVGIVINETTGELIEGDIASSNWTDSLFNSTNGLIALIGIGGAVIVGLWTRTFDWRIVLIGFFTAFVTKFITFGWGIVQLAMDTGETWLIAIIATVFLPLTVMFVFSIVEWFGGYE